jgi:hypothetical protein
MKKSYQKRNYTNEYITNPSIKFKLIKYIFNNIKLSDYDYKVIDHLGQLKPLNDRKFYIMPNFNGNPCLLIFNKIDNKYYSYIVHRQTLKYNVKEIKMDDVKIYPIDIRLSKDLYNGTIFDGTLLNSSSTKKKTFVINDTYLLKGKNITKQNVKDKKLNIDCYFEINYKEDSLLNTIDLLSNSIYNLDELENLVNNIIMEHPLQTFIKGVTFVEEFSATKLIFRYSQYDNEKIEKNKQNIIVKSTIINVEGKITAIFLIKKNKSNIYKLYLCKKTRIDGKKNVKHIKYGFADLIIPDNIRFCNDLFDSSNSSKIFVKCKYNNKKNTWTPYEHVTNINFPDTEKSVNKKLNIN